jgi:hypothetical protein
MGYSNRINVGVLLSHKKRQVSKITVKCFNYDYYEDFSAQDKRVGKYTF